jgi:hypothetical protein
MQVIPRVIYHFVGGFAPAGCCVPRKGARNWLLVVSSICNVTTKKAFLFSTAFVLCFNCFSQTKNDPIYLNFFTPPNSAKPRVWWHWMNGNITKDGIRKDLEWMQRVGIGGFQNFDAALGTPQIVEKRLTYMTPDWIDAFRFTTRLADSLHLEMAIAGSPGWSESGGPWVKGEDGMKKIVWTETNVKGGGSKIVLPKPQDVTGPFQNISKGLEFGESGDNGKKYHLYKDVAVVAYKLPAADVSMKDLNPTVTSSGGKFTLSQLIDGDLETKNLLPRDSTNGYGWIQFAFTQPQTIKAITMVGGGNPGVFGFGADAKDSRKLEASEDGTHFTLVSIIPPGAVLEQTISLPATTAKYFRVTVKNPPPPANIGSEFGFSGIPIKDPGGTEIAEIVLHTADRINNFEEKDAFAPVGDLDKKITASTNDVIATSDIIDLTNKLNADGSLNWTAPPGIWNIVRFGYSLMGINNHPASPEATGLEVDKLDPAAIKRYFTNYLDQYKNATGGLMGSKGGLQYIITDSWEAGAQNWTANLPTEFQKRRGYNMIPWLPVLTGHIIKSAGASEQFLFDFRKTLSDLVAEYHYDGLTKILAARGMKRYSESHEDGRALIADGMEVKRTAAIPMSALWTPNPFINQNDQTKHTIDIRESASVAHIYGQNLVAAESLTALGIGGTAWAYCPENLKPSVDLELANGLNRFVIHCSVHQPVDDKIPGLGLGPFGQWYTRHETWAEQATAWNAYLSRSSYLLQQGKFVADIVYYYGEDNNITNLFGKRPPSIPEGYNYDFINSDALIHLLSVRNGRLVTPSGMSYRVLVLDSSAIKMSLPVLRKINALVKEGAVITGVKPVATPSLSDDQNEFKKLVAETWASSNTKVSSGKALSEVLNELRVIPDFSFDKPESDTKLLYVHRKLADRDIYWVNNRKDRTEHVQAQFRTAGKVPILWHAETGTTEQVSYTIANGTTKVDLYLESNDAVFVVFKDRAARSSVQLPTKQQKELLTVIGPWNVAFQEKRGAPPSAKFNQLKSYTDNADPGIKYFSGIATYTKTITAEASWFVARNELWLDLGDVKNLAEVIVNGKSLGIIWKKPFRVNAATALKPGDNKVEIKVTNLWVNRLIGDAQPGVTNKITYTTMPFYQANSKLLPSGLLGPVRVVALE